MILTFDCYSGQSGSVQHLRHYQDKVVIHSRNDSILYRIFPSNLKGVDSDWLYSLQPCSIHSFGDLTRLFLAQYSSLQGFKQNNHHLLSIKIMPSDSFKNYISYFHNQLAKVHNCNEDASDLAFISVPRSPTHYTSIW